MLDYAVKRLRKAVIMLKKKIAISCDEWYPYYDIREIEEKSNAYDRERVANIDYDDYFIYRGLLTQMEKLQKKLDILWMNGQRGSK